MKDNAGNVLMYVTDELQNLNAEFHKTVHDLIQAKNDGGAAIKTTWSKK